MLRPSCGLLLALVAASGCAPEMVQLVPRDGLTVQVALAEVRRRRPKKIEDLPEDLREFLRDAFNEHFNYVRGFSVRQGSEPEDFDQTIGVCLEEVAKLCKGKSPNWCLAFFGKPACVFASRPNELELWYRTDQNMTDTLMFRGGKLVRSVRMCINFGFALNNKIDHMLARMDERGGTRLDDLDEDTRRMFRRAFNRYFSGGVARAQREPASEVPAQTEESSGSVLMYKIDRPKPPGIRRQIPREPDEVVEKAVLCLVRLCEGQHSGFVLDFFGKPASVMPLTQGKIQITYQTHSGKKIVWRFTNYSCQGKATIVDVETGPSPAE